MSTVKSDLLHELTTRGYIHQCTDEAELDKLAQSEIVTGYIGFDCTAPSLHVGNLVSIMLLRKLTLTVRWITKPRWEILPIRLSEKLIPSMRGNDSWSIPSQLSYGTQTPPDDPS